MKKVVFVLCFVVGLVRAQEITAKWTPKLSFDSKSLFFKNYIDNNSKYTYAKYGQVGIGANKKLKLVAFDKVTFKQVAEVPIKGFPENEANKKDLNDLDYYKTIVFENVIYVFWMKENKEKDELYVQTFNANLKPQNKLKKIYELKTVKGDKKKAELFIMGNKDVGEKLIIGGELSGDKQEKVKIELKVLKSDLSTTNAYQIELPLVITGRSDRLSSSYRYGDDGNLYVKFDNMLTIINPETGEKFVFNSEYADKKIYDFDFIETKDKIKIFGMFSDLKKNKSGNDIHGIYSVTLENKSFKVKDNNFTYFTKDQLDKLFSKDQEDRKDKAGIFSSKKKKESEESSLGSSYTVESAMIEGDDIVFFCSKMFNYSRTTTTTTNGVTSTQTYYYCQKDNVTGFRVTSDGKIIWASNVDRRITYSRWNVYDISVVKKGNSFLVIYGSVFKDNVSKKGCFKMKSNKQLMDEMEYASFDATSGISSKKTFVVNKKNTPKKERKSVSADDISVIDNDFYIASVSNRPRTVVCFIPVLYYCVPFVPSLTVGEGYLGTFTTK